MAASSKRRNLFDSLIDPDIDQAPTTSREPIEPDPEHESDEDLTYDSEDDFIPNDSDCSDSSEDELDEHNIEHGESLLSDSDSEGYDVDLQSLHQNEAAEGFMTGKDGTKWMYSPPDVNRTPRHNIIRAGRSIRNVQGHLTDIVTSYQLYINDIIINDIVEHTNSEAERVYAAKNLRCRWKTNPIEIRAYIGLILAAGHLKQNYTSKKMWSEKYGHALFRAAFSLQRFKTITQFLRFDDKETRNARREKDKLAPIRDIFDSLNQNLQRFYRPGDNLTVDEQLVPFRGRCPFLQYMPSKPDKYGMKIFGITDSKTFYPLKGKPYLGKEGRVPEKNLGQKVVLELSALFNHSNRNITTDNFFTSLPLAIALKGNGLTIVGTVRKNKTFIPPSFLPSRQRATNSCEFGFQKHFSLVSHVPKQGKAVLLLSSMHHDKAIDAESGKPEINLYYNETKGGVDSLDQLIHSYMSKRQTRRWPLTYFYNMLDIAGVAAFILWTLDNPEWHRNKNHRRRLFLEELSEELVLPQIHQRVLQKGLPRSVLLSAELCGVVIQRPSTSGPTPSLPVSGKRKRCFICPRNKERKSKQVCDECARPICGEHSRTKRICNNCN